MGLCILFPALCGLKNSGRATDEQLEMIARIEQLTAHVVSDMTFSFDSCMGAAEAEAIIARARYFAHDVLQRNDINPYEV